MEDLNKISGKNPFKVPDNYFEEVNRKIFSVTTGYSIENNKEPKIRRLRPYLLIAASVVIMAVIGFSSFYFFSLRNTPDLPELSIKEFSDNYLNDIDLLVLEEKAGSLDNLETRLALTSNDIFEYFEFENVDINDITY
jgi:hypothetical protein